MKKILFIIFTLFLSFILIGASKPSLDGRANVANVGELPVGLFAKSPGYLPGDTVIVTNPQANISIEVMIFGTFDSSEGIAIVLSPEAAKELFIAKGSNVIVQVTKKSDAYSENTILAKTVQNYSPSSDPDRNSENLFNDTIFSDLLEEENEEYVIPLEDILAETLVEEELPEERDALVEEELPEESDALVEEEIPEETDALVEDEIPEETDALVEEEIPEESDALVEEEILEETDALVEEELLEDEYVAEMDETTYEIAEEVDLVPTELNPPVLTIIPVPLDEEIEEVIEDSDMFDEPEVIFVENIDELDELEEVQNSTETRNIIPVEDVIEIVVEEVVKPTINTVEKLESGKYFVQIATYSKVENVEKILSTYGNNYPIVCYQPSGRSDYQVMIGGLNKDEYAIVLERFRKAGYKDAFLRSTF